MLNNARIVRLLLLSAAGTASISSALAQTVEANATTSDDIIVTATKREQNLTDVPASITAISGDMLAQKGQHNLSDLNAAVPGLQISTNNTDVSITLRGVGHSLFSPSAENSVALHLDGVYLGTPSAGQSAFFDVERVEVLRGPQGTLYGRNATGGAINIISGSPTDRFTGHVQVGVANYARTDVEGVVSGPLVDGLVSGRLGGFYHRRANGFGRNLFTGNDVDDLAEEGAKAALLIAPGDHLKIMLRGDYYHANDSAGLFHVAGEVRQFYPGAPSLPRALGVATFTDVRDISSDVDNHRNLTSTGVSAEVTYEVSDSLSVRSLTAYRHNATTYLTDIDASNLVIFGPFNYYAKAHQLSEELQANWTIGNVYVVAGAYYFGSKNDSRLLIDSYLARGIPTLNVPPILPAPFGVFNQIGQSKIDAKALYMNADWTVNDRLTIGGGLRYSREVKTNVGSEVAFFPDFADWPATGYIVANDRRSSNSLTPRLTATYKVAQNANIYASVSKGFKSGEFIAGTDQYAKPESVWAYEIGIKGSAFDRRLRGSVGVFYYDYTNLQVQRLQVPFTFLNNVPKGVLKGIEAEGSVHLPAGITLDGNTTLLDTRMSGFSSDDPNIAGSPLRDLTGNRFAYAPKFTANVGVEKKWDTGPLRNGVVRVDYQYVGDTYLDIYNSTNTSFRPAHSIWNASYKQSSHDESWSFLIWIKNLTNKTVINFSDTNAIPNVLIPAASASLQQVNLNEPRTFGLTLGYNW